MSEHCNRKKCIYRHEPRTNAPNYCDYCAITGKSRIAQIPDKRKWRAWRSCPCYAEGSKRASRPRFPGEGERRYDWAKGMALYRKGATDREIAEKLGCSISGVRQWRRKLKLEAKVRRRDDGEL